MQDIIEQFRSAMLDAGIRYNGDIKPDAGLQRFTIDGDKPKSLNGWYTLHSDGVPAGEFGSWKTGLSSSWCAKKSTEITPEERKAIADRAERVKKERAQMEAEKHKEAAETAAMIWEAAEPAQSHPYLTRKKIHPSGTRIGKWPVGDTVIENALIIPIRDGKKITSLQAIFKNSDNIYGRDKTFLPGGAKKGGYYVIGSLNKNTPPDHIAITEGFATGASIHESTGWPVVVAFNANNLPEVTTKVRRLFLQAKIVICADNDQWTKEPIDNPGVHYAKLAAADNNAFVAIPEFSDTADKPTDFNDLFVQYGAEMVAAQIMQSLSPIAIIEKNDNPITEYQAVDFISPLPDVNGSNKPLSTIENLNEMCRRLSVTVRYNVITKEEEILIPCESFSVDNQANASLAYLMSWAGRFRFPTGQIGDFVTYLADKNLFNPVAEWITSTDWDGKSRLQALYDTLTVENEDEDQLQKDLKEILIKRWLISAVAAAFEPHGVSAHGVLVIQGRQSLGKTAWFKRLVPKHLGVIADGLMLKPDDKDSVKQAVSNWLVELGELDATFRKADIAQLKSFLTRDRDTLRRAYARRESTFARRTVFFASVNPKEFLHDSTGNRRYWTLSCTSINHKHDIDMQQIWAEVYQEYKNGEPWVLWPHELDALNEINRNYETIDPITERLQSKLDWDAPKLSWHWRTATEILMLIGIDKPTHQDSTRCSQSMKELNGDETKRTKVGRLLHCPPRFNN